MLPADEAEAAVVRADAPCATGPSSRSVRSRVQWRTYNSRMGRRLISRINWSFTLFVAGALLAVVAVAPERFGGLSGTLGALGLVLMVAGLILYGRRSRGAGGPPGGGPSGGGHHHGGGHGGGFGGHGGGGGHG